MHLSVKKWGNSAAVRIPVQVMNAVRLEVDQLVDVREEGGVIVIEPIKKPGYKLENLLAQISPENLHQEIESGKPKGKEEW